MNEKSSSGLAGWVSVGVHALLPAAAIGGGNAVAPLAALAGLLSAPVSGWRNLVVQSWPWSVPLMGFTLFAAASVAWSPAASTLQGYKLLGGVVLGLLWAAGVSRMSVKAINTTAIAVLVGAGLLTLLALIEALFGLPINRLAQPQAIDWMLARNPGKGTSVLVVAIWPAVVIAATVLDGRLRVFAIALLCAAGYSSFQFGQAANAAAFTTGALAAGAALVLGGRFVVRAVFIAIAGWLVASPFVVSQLSGAMGELPFSVAHRFAIWQFASETALQHPLVGLGIDASRTLGETAIVQGAEVKLMPLHPHSASLQIWLELGAVGVGLGALALVVGGLLASNAVRLHRPTAAAVAGSAAAFATLSNFSYGAWQEWWIGVAFIAAVGCLALWRFADQQVASEDAFAFVVE